MSTENENGDLFDIPDALAARCMRLQGWSTVFTDKAIVGYRQFMKLKLQQEDWDATILSPSLTVDLVWHQHILDVRHYAKACQEYTDGEVIGHDPDGGLDPTKRSERIQNTKIALRTLCGRSFDEEVWSFSDDKENDRNKRRRSSPIPADGAITIKVRDRFGEETFFKLPRKNTLAKVFHAYAAHIGVDDPTTLRFLLNGERIFDWDTPQMLGIEDQQQIDCMLECTGC